MTEGKANAQSGHAYVDALLHSLSHPDDEIRARAEAYARLRPGTKISLDGGSAADFDLLIAKLRAQGVPHVVIVDRDHVEPPHFDGSPIVTAIGLGPFTRRDTPKCLRLPKWDGGARTRAASSHHQHQENQHAS